MDTSVSIFQMDVFIPYIYITTYKEILIIYRLIRRLLVNYVPNNIYQYLFLNDSTSIQKDNVMGRKIDRYTRNKNFPKETVWVTFKY